MSFNRYLKPLFLFFVFGISHAAPAPNVDELTEELANSWQAMAESGDAFVSQSSSQVHDGSSSVHLNTDSGFDVWFWAPSDRSADWNLEDIFYIRFWAYSENPNIGFQNNSPWLRLGSSESDYLEFTPRGDILNASRGEWVEIVIPFVGDSTWRVDQVGEPDLANIDYVEIHADTWEHGFDLWIDGLAFLSVDGLVFERASLPLFETWQFSPRVNASTEIGELPFPPNGIDTWNSARPNIASIDDVGRLIARRAGSSTVSASYRGNTAELLVDVASPVIEPEFESVAPDLALPAQDARWEMPVLVLRYIPTADGETLDLSASPTDLGIEMSLEDVKSRIDAFDLRVKLILEEGSRFRDYGREIVRPSLGYRVVDYITVYEPLPPAHIARNDVAGNPVYAVDYHGLFERFDVQYYVEDLGVKEIWLWHFPFDSGHGNFDPSVHDSINARALWESNLASPLTGDISNSDRDSSDLPVFENSYVVYSQNIGRTQAEAIHNHGHQLESILGHANWLAEGSSDFFWRDFVGVDDVGQMQLGRAGWTHMPPNTTQHYDYQNLFLAASDIEDWRPDGGGNLVEVNADYWSAIAFPWNEPLVQIPQRTESHWYMYWMQSMPGLGNVIQRGSEYLTNWWTFTGDWDESIELELGLAVDSSKPRQAKPRRYEIGPEISGAWFDPSHDGEGFIVEYLSETSVLVYWFSFDDQGRQAWMVGTGTIDGHRLVLADIYRTRGPQFGSGFDPSDTIAERWGSLHFEFGSCSGAIARYSGPAEFGEGSLRLRRVYHIDGSHCDDLSLASEKITRGVMTGSWYDPSHDGEGWILHMIGEGRAVVYWFTYTQTGEQAWFVGVGEAAEAGFTFDVLSQVSGPRFGSSFDPQDRVTTPWGSFTLNFASCDAGSATFDSSLWNMSGEFNARRLTKPVGASCSGRTDWAGGAMFVAGNPDTDILGGSVSSDGSSLVFAGERSSSGVPSQVSRLQVESPSGDLLSQADIDQFDRPAAVVQPDGTSYQIEWSGSSAVVSLVNSDGNVESAIEIESEPRLLLKRGLPEHIGKKFEISQNSSKSAGGMPVRVRMVRSNGTPVTRGTVIARLDERAGGRVLTRHIPNPPNGVAEFAIPTEVFELGPQVAEVCRGMVDTLLQLCPEDPNVSDQIERFAAFMIATGCSALAATAANPGLYFPCVAVFSFYEAVCGVATSVATTAFIAACEGVDQANIVRFNEIQAAGYNLTVEAAIRGAIYEPTVGNPTRFSGQSLPSEIDLTIRPDIEVNVGADSPSGVDTGITVQRGQMVTFSASGSWCWGSNACTNGNGTPGRPNSEELPVLVIGARFGTLVGRAGSCKFVIGSNATVAMPCGGRLRLMMSDRLGYYFDNYGMLTVSVQ